MLRSGQLIENPVSGVRLLMDDLGSGSESTIFVVEHFIPPGAGKDPIAHWHTIARERFEILAGSARLQLAGKEQAAAQGDALDFPPQISHLHPWNVGENELHLRQTITLLRPDPRYVIVHTIFFETLFGLARDGKVDKRGQPNALQLAVMARSLHPYTYLDGMSPTAQHLLFGAMALAGRALGYRTQYPQYDQGEKQNGIQDNTIGSDSVDVPAR